MDIEKTFRVAAPRDEVWAFVTSAEKVATCMPGVEGVTIVSPGKYKGKMTLKVGPIKTSVKADVEELEQRPPEFAAYAIKGEEGGRASSMSSDTKLSLSAISEQETEVYFESHVRIVGRLGKFSGGAMQKVADSMSERFIQNFRAELEPEYEVPERIGLWQRILAFLRRLFGGGREANA